MFVGNDTTRGIGATSSGLPSLWRPHTGGVAAPLAVLARPGARSGPEVLKREDLCGTEEIRVLRGG